jgi:MFS family permease
MYEVRERGRRLGWFYGMPMLGPTLGPLLGGALGNAYGWRATLYFLAVFAFVMLVCFCFFPDTWRRERSRVYQKAVAAALRRQLKAQAVAEKREAKRERKRARGLSSSATTPGPTNPPTPGHMTPSESLYDPEAAQPRQPGWVARTRARLGLKPSDELRPSFVDLNPLPSTISVFRGPTNAAVLLASGLLFAVQYTTTYTASVTFARPPYSYNPLIIGVVLVSFGVGNVVGSVVGGRWSDYALRRLTAANGGVTEPEMRLKCTLPAMPILLIAYLIYGWTADYTTHIAGPVVGLFLAGFALLFVYSSTLAYLVDSNPGRAASAVACNSFMRGAVACVMSQVAIPIQNGIGDGGLYTLFTGVLGLSCATLVLVSYKGKGWREAKAAKKEARSAATSGANSVQGLSGANSGVSSARGSRAPSVYKGNTESPNTLAVSEKAEKAEEKGS